MSRHGLALLAFCGFAIPLATPVFAQSSGSAHSRVPSTNQPAAAKRTVNDAATAAAAASASPVTGNFVAKFTIKLASYLPSGYNVYCSLSATVIDENTTTYSLDNEIYESATGKATVSGSTATCSTDTPYSWYLSDTSTDTVSLNYTLYYLNPSATNDSGEIRYSSQYVPGAGSIKVPATGTTLTYNISATM